MQRTVAVSTPMTSVRRTAPMTAKQLLAIVGTLPDHAVLTDVLYPRKDRDRDAKEAWTGWLGSSTCTSNRLGCCYGCASSSG